MKRFALALGLVALAVLGLGMSQTAHAAKSPVTAQVYHDMSHPVKVNYPCAGMSHSGVSIGPSVPTFNCSHLKTSAGRGIIPNANNPSSSCNGGVAYQQSYNNSNKWYASGAGSAGSNVDSWVEYYWCPTSTGSINWALGHAFARTGCITVAVGGYAPFINSWYFKQTGIDGTFFGAAMIQSNGNLVGDGESYHAVGNPVCIAQNQYVWDYSHTGNGSQSWQPHMYGNVYNSSDDSDANWGWGHYQ